MSDGEVPDVEALLIALQGRIVALEKLMAGLVTIAAAGGEPGGVERLQRMRSGMRETEQLLDRPTGEYADRVMEAASEALDVLFANAMNRAERLQGD